MKQRTRKSYRQGENAWLNHDHAQVTLIFLIVCCFPVGLYLMWSVECDWQRWIKSTISLVFVAMIACIFFLLPPVPEARLEGSVEIIGMEASREMFAPLKPKGVPDTAQLVKKASETSALISEPTPTPNPVMVYCNDNGLYYHMKGCRYVYTTTPRVTLLQALNAGKKACSICDPPNEFTY